jgi:lysozyme family protein
MKVFFDYCLDVVLRNEGGLLTDASAAKVGDPGGETYKGITAATLVRLGIEKTPSSLTDEEVREIYRTEYYAIKGGPRTIVPESPGLALAVFDAGVQHGPRRAIMWAQIIAGTKADGIVGPITLKALNRLGEATAIVRFHEMRRLHVSRWVQMNPSRLPLLTGLIGRIDLMERTALYVLVDEASHRTLSEVFTSGGLTRA